MATTAFLAPSGFSIQGWSANGEARRRKACSIRAQQLKQEREPQSQTLSDGKLPAQQQGGGARVQQQLPPQPMAKSKNMSREYGGQWLSSCTRHVRIYAAYIDPVTHAFDQTQMDKLTLILDPSNEFVWTPDTCQKVYAYFQELVDHYEGAPLSEYTLRLVGSDIEHYIRKLLYDGDEDSRTNNFEEMGNDGVNNGEQIFTQQTNSRDQTKAMEEMEHPTLDVIDDPLYIIGGPIARSRARKMKKEQYGLIEKAKVKAIIEADLTKDE